MQTRTMSLLEVCASTAVGYVVAVLSQVAIFPMFGIHIPFSSNLLIGLYFTIISIARGYIVRRWFNGLKFKRKPHAAQTTSL